MRQESAEKTQQENVEIKNPSEDAKTSTISIIKSTAKLNDMPAARDNAITKSSSDTKEIASNEIQAEEQKESSSGRGSSLNRNSTKMGPESAENTNQTTTKFSRKIEELPDNDSHPEEMKMTTNEEKSSPCSDFTSHGKNTNAAMLYRKMYNLNKTQQENVEIKNPSEVAKTSTIKSTAKLNDMPAARDNAITKSSSDTTEIANNEIQAEEQKESSQIKIDNHTDSSSHSNTSISIAKLSSENLSSFWDGFSGDEKIEQKRKSIESWVEDSTQSLCASSASDIIPSSNPLAKSRVHARKEEPPSALTENILPSIPVNSLGHSKKEEYPSVSTENILCSSKPSSNQSSTHETVNNFLPTEENISSTCQASLIPDNPRNGKYLTTTSTHDETPIKYSETSLINAISDEDKLNNKTESKTESSQGTLLEEKLVRNTPPHNAKLSVLDEDSPINDPKNTNGSTAAFTCERIVQEHELDTHNEHTLVNQPKEDQIATLCVELGLITKSSDFDQLKNNLIKAEIMRKANVQTAPVSKTATQQVIECHCADSHYKDTTATTSPPADEPVKWHIPHPSTCALMNSEDRMAWAKLASSDFSLPSRPSSYTKYMHPVTSPISTYSAVSTNSFDLIVDKPKSYQRHMNITGCSDSEDSIIRSLKDDIKKLDEKNSIQNEEIEKERKRVKELHRHIYELKHDIKEQKFMNNCQVRRMEKDSQYMETNYKKQLSVAGAKCRTAKELHHIKKLKDQDLIQTSNMSVKFISKQKRDLEEIHCQLLKEMGALREKSQSQKNDLSALIFDLNATRDEERQLKLACDMSEKVLITLRGELSAAHMEGRGKDKEIHDWQSKYQDMVTSISEYKKETKKLKKILEEKNEQLANATKRESEAKTKATQLEECSKKLQKQRYNGKMIIKSLQGKLNIRQQQNVTIREKFEGLIDRKEKEFQEETCKMKESELMLKKELLDTQLKLRDVTMKVSDLEVRNNSMQTKVNSLEKNKIITAANRENREQLAINTKKTENELRARVEELQDHIRWAKSMNRSLQDDKDQLVRKASSLECQLTQTCTENEAHYEIMKRKMGYSESQISKLEEQVEKQRSEKVSVCLDLQDAQKRAKQAELSVKQKDVAIGALKCQIEQLKEETERERSDGTTVEEEKVYQTCITKMKIELDLNKTSHQKCKTLVEENKTLVRDLKEAHSEKNTIMKQLKAYTNEDQQREILKNEIKVLKNYLVKKIELLHSAELLAGEQANTIRRLRIREKKMMEKAQCPSDSEEDENEIRLQIRREYKRKWQEKKRMLAKDTASERNSMQEDLQDLQGQVEDLQRTITDEKRYDSTYYVNSQEENMAKPALSLSSSNNPKMEGTKRGNEKVPNVTLSSGEDSSIKSWSDAGSFLDNHLSDVLPKTKSFI